MRHANALAIVIAGTLIAGSLLFASRTVTTPTPFGYVERDRWTGRAIACQVTVPENFIDTASRRMAGGLSYDPPRICVDLKQEDFLHFDAMEGAAAKRGPWEDFKPQQPK